MARLYTGAREAGRWRRAMPGERSKHKKTPALAGVSRCDRPDRFDQKFMSKATSPCTPTW